MPAANKPSLDTLGDFFRFAVRRLRAARLAYGHGTTNAVDEAAFLMLEALRLPIHRIDPGLDLKPRLDEGVIRLIAGFSARPQDCASAFRIPPCSTGSATPSHRGYSQRHSTSSPRSARPSFPSTTRRFAKRRCCSMAVRG